MSTNCDQITDDLADLVANDPAAIERHADHLADCDTCRDARHEATNLAALLAHAGSDHAAAATDALVARVLAAADADAKSSTAKPAVVVDAAPVVVTPAAVIAVAAKPAEVAEKPAAKAKPASTTTPSAPTPSAPTPIESAKRRDPVRPVPRSRWIAIGAIAATAAGGVGIYKLRGDKVAPVTATSAPIAASTAIGKVDTVERGAADGLSGIELRDANGWRPLKKDEAVPAGAELRTDERTRAALVLVDGSRLVLDHRTSLAFDAKEPRRVKLGGGRVVADVAHIDGRPAVFTTPSGTIDVVGTKFALTASDTLTSVHVVRGSVVLASGGKRADVRAGEEGSIDGGQLAVSPAPSLSREVSWAELLGPATPDQVSSGIGALRAYKPGESRDKDWKLALAKHDVKVRIVGPIARTEITETFRNDSDTILEGVYQFPLPADAQIDGLSLDVKEAPGGFLDGAFLDKERGAKIWKGVIDKASPKPQIATNEMIWVPGKWRDPALLDWKRGGRFELKIFPIPGKGSRTIKIAYTQVVTPRGPWRQYIYPLPHSADGSTVADNFTVDVEVRGAKPGLVRAAGYKLAADPARKDVNALTLAQGGFVPRGDLVVDYHATDGDAELRAWSFAGGAAVAPDDKIAKTKNVGIDPKVVEAQRAVAADLRPTAVLALHPKLPRWSENKPRDYIIVVDGSQSMVGERFTRAGDLTASMIDQMDRRDRFSVLVCDSECRKLGDLRAPSNKATADVRTFLTSQPPTGASDLVAAVRAASDELRSQNAPQNERWVLFIGDGFSTTGFRRVADVERAIAETTTPAGIHVTTIGIGTDADSNVLGAAARGGGGSYLAWLPGERVSTAAAVALESTFGSALQNATVELPAGLSDVAPSILPTIRAGGEVLLAARMTGDVNGEVVVKGLVGGQPYEQRFPLKLAVSSAAGNGFVPRLWASLSIDQLERTGGGTDRTKIVALSQGYGVMSRETSLLVLESQAMFDAFGVDRGQPTTKWTGEEQLDEVIGTGLMAPAPDPVATTTPSMAPAAATGASMNKNDSPSDSGYADKDMPKPAEARPEPKAEKRPEPAKKPAMAKRKSLDDEMFDGDRGRGGRARDMIRVHRTWLRIPSISPYGGVNPAITKAIADAEVALAANPDSRERHRSLVQALSYAGEIDKARDVAVRWLERDKLDGQALGYQADLLGRDGQRDLALRTLAGLVDLDPDRVVLHERMVRSYDAAGRLAQACSHRIALAALQPKIIAPAGAAIRCLRGLGREPDAQLIARALPDDAARATAEKLATVSPVAVRASGDLVVAGHWDAGADLDLTIVTPDGSRVSWMGGRVDAIVTDATSAEREQLAIKSIKRGNYLIEVGRGKSSTAVARGAVRGTLDVTLLGQRRTMQFELTGSRAVVGHVGITLMEQMVDENGTPVYRNYGEPGWDRGRRIRPTNGGPGGPGGRQRPL